jgi:hypothetical protein
MFGPALARRSAIVGACFGCLALVGAAAQGPQPERYAIVAVTLPRPAADPSFDAFRRELAGIAEKRDRAALARLAGSAFFWERDFGGGFENDKPAFDNLVAALGLADEDGWNALVANMREDAGPHARRRAIVCAPGEPRYSGRAFAKLVDATRSDVFDWSYPRRAGLEVRAAARADAPVVEMLGLHFVFTDIAARPPDFDPDTHWNPAVTPAGRRGFVAPGSLLTPLDPRLCFAKKAGRWRIAGFIGGGD